MAPYRIPGAYQLQSSKYNIYLMRLLLIPAGF